MLRGSAPYVFSILKPKPQRIGRKRTTMTSSDADESGGGAILPRPPPSKPNDERRAAHLMSEIQRRKNDKTRERTSAEELARSIVPKLASRAYHLDGNKLVHELHLAPTCLIR